MSDTIVEEFAGHCEVVNKYRRVRSQGEGEEYYEMQTFSGEWFKFDIEDLAKVQNVAQIHGKLPTWEYIHTGYIGCRYTTEGQEKKQILYLHVHVIGYTGNKRKIKLIEHINFDKLDNRKENIQFTDEVTDVDIESKEGKEAVKPRRRCDARPLPEGITQADLPRYVIYYKECKNKEKGTYIEYFKIENKQVLVKPWFSSKSNKVSVHVKLASAIAKIEELGLDL